jgi:hypothetical protein
MLILVNGLNRSGNHATIGWLLDILRNQFPDTAPVHVNNLAPNQCTREKLALVFDETLDKTVHRRRDHRWCPCHPDQPVIVSLEAEMPTTVRKCQVDLRPDVSVQIVRSYKNNMASLYHIHKKLNAHYLSVSMANATDPVGVPVVYDEWIDNESYRKWLCDEMNLKFTDDGFKHRIRWANSRFTDSTPSTTRWHMYKDDEKFRKLVLDDTTACSRHEAALVECLLAYRKSLIRS